MGKQQASLRRRYGCRVRPEGHTPSLKLSLPTAPEFGDRPGGNPPSRFEFSEHLSIPRAPPARM
eukprot:CAMPEP_0176041680 /NCGR_PEP_ID=MMETSP0120_2-20121206/20675_1 /TAXON_ID=160619 /ORGANISM="Kryptoperidinium foliaceum, Strain CCMP 1326" /LENGTH=63 /DNA_ID=CAMNT_0017375083 /DNA_START=38 /DNA_END=229 /DNA_ORIENTATION=-